MRYIAALLVFGLVLPVSTYASHSTYGSRVDRSDLDDDPMDTFPIPILFGVDLSDITPDFGDPRDGGTRSHEGQDMRAPEGTPIMSPTEAIVIRTGSGASSGNYVYTANPGGETFRYMHLDDIANLDPGDKLDVGDYIGTVGDTGNAPDGVFHLHFEVRDEDNKATDPYPRLSDGWDLEEKMSILRDVFRKIRNDDDYAEFLVETFPSEFQLALQRGYDLPPVIEEALEDKGIVSEAEKLEQLTDLIQSLPGLINLELRNGDQNAAVIILQLYLIYVSEGSARNALKTAGPTGYFGAVTEAALTEYQEDNLLVVTKGIYDSRTREAMMKKNNIELNLQ